MNETVLFVRSFKRGMKAILNNESCLLGVLLTPIEDIFRKRRNSLPIRERENTTIHVSNLGLVPIGSSTDLGMHKRRLSLHSLPFRGSRCGSNELSPFIF